MSACRVGTRATGYPLGPCRLLSPPGLPPGAARDRTDEAQLKSLLAPYPSDGLVCWPVSARVGNVKNNDPSLVDPIAFQ
jgi:hypothetical protein